MHTHNKSYKIEIDWQEPIDIAAKFSSEEVMVFLYSSRINKENYHSYIGLFVNEEVYPLEINDKFFKNANNEILDRYFGYYSYELKHTIEECFTNVNKSVINPPLSYFAKFNLVITFNHENKSIYIQYRDEKYLNKFYEILSTNNDLKTKPKAISISSNMSKEEYLDKVNEIKAHILEGEVYQANLTRKFYGKLNFYNSLEIFKDLVTISPANYSAYFKIRDLSIVSSSPELFLSLNENDEVTTEPIKGTIGRKVNSLEDEVTKLGLINDMKNRAENLMIVDLMRNDLNRSCIPGSVIVPELFKCTTYTDLHHLSSIVIGKKEREVLASKVIVNAFPPGSMTGAPKIAVIKLCEKLENIERGIYSGILGWFTPNLGFRFSVVIRTIIFKNEEFEFQVGGGITIDSNPYDEYEETLVKAKSICKVLKIEIIE
ncbi:MAG: chorismate-binding protein [Sphingobacteriia bacterium]|nr:chorismate-binding protein [Sphingobacteriia bacterium]